MDRSYFAEFWQVSPRTLAWLNSHNVTLADLPRYSYSTGSGEATPRFLGNDPRRFVAKVLRLTRKNVHNRA
jgi:hypothetical protein